MCLFVFLFAALWAPPVSQPLESCLVVKLRTAVCVAVGKKQSARPSRCSSPCITLNRTRRVSLRYFFTPKGTLIRTIYSFHFALSEKTVKEYDFAEILKKSICLEQSTQAWCENCEKYQPTVSSSVQSHPTVAQPINK